MPQLDGPVSLLTRDAIGRRVQEDSRFEGQEYSQGGTYVQGASISWRREYPGESSDDDNVNRRPYRDQRPPVRGRYPSQSGRLPDWRGYPDRGSPRRGYPNRDGRPSRREGYPGGGPPDGRWPPMEMEDPLMVEDPMEMEDPLDPWWTRTTRPSRTPWASETYNSPDSSSNTGYICSREYFWFIGAVYVAVGQSTRPNK